MFYLYSYYVLIRNEKCRFGHERRRKDSQQSWRWVFFPRNYFRKSSTHWPYVRAGRKGSLAQGVDSIIHLSPSFPWGKKIFSRPPPVFAYTVFCMDKVECNRKIVSNTLLARVKIGEKKHTSLSLSLSLPDIIMTPVPNAYSLAKA